MPLSVRELLAAAHTVQRRRGDGAAAWICGLIAELDKAGDISGADTWSEVFGCLAEIESQHVGTLQ